MTNPWVQPHAIAHTRGTMRFTGPGIVGVVNVTPDSFSDGGEHASTAQAIAHAHDLVAAGAVLIDVGGESTRPGAAPLPPGAEQRRVIPVIEVLADAGHTISIDTRNAATARAACAAGAHFVNDVAGFRDPAMQDVIAETGSAAIIMHMQGEPATMQDNPSYTDVVAEVAEYLHTQAKRLTQLGAQSVIIDPGIGFGKRLPHNLALLRSVPTLAEIAPVLIGASRKSFINAITPAPTPGKRLAGTLAAHDLAATGGAALIRAHDVFEHQQYFAVRRALEEES